MLGFHFHFSTSLIAFQLKEASGHASTTSAFSTAPEGVMSSSTTTQPPPPHMSLRAQSDRIGSRVGGACAQEPRTAARDTREVARIWNRISRPNGSVFSGVAQPCTATVNARDFAILPRSISAPRCHVRCNGLLCGTFDYEPRPASCSFRMHCRDNSTIDCATRSASSHGVGLT